MPRAAYRAIADPTIPLWVTEGARKADAAVSAGLDCVSLGGVWNWRGTNGQGGKTALPDWEMVALNGRVLHLCFDSDVVTKAEVAKALQRFTAFLEYKRATVHPVYLPAAPGEKVGLDDFLAAHGREALLELAAKTTTARSTGAPPASRHPRRPDPHGPRSRPARSRNSSTSSGVDADRRSRPDAGVLATYVANRKLDGDPIWLMPSADPARARPSGSSR